MCRPTIVLGTSSFIADRTCRPTSDYRINQALREIAFRHVFFSTFTRFEAGRMIIVCRRCTLFIRVTINAKASVDRLKTEKSFAANGFVKVCLAVCSGFSTLVAVGALRRVSPTT